MASPNPETLRVLLERRLSRRRLLQGGASLLALAAVDRPALGAGRGRLAFEPVAPSDRDEVLVPPGYRADVVLRWGDALFTGVPSLDATRVASGALLAPDAPAAQAGQFGYNCDGLGLFALPDGGLLVGVNHEFPTPALLFPGWAEAGREGRAAFVREHRSVVRYMQAAVGLSFVELERTERWTCRVSGRLNRRVTAASPFELRGPAASHPLLRGSGGEPEVVAGTLGNCAAGPTPWGTYLSGEENIDDYFGNGAAVRSDPDLARAYLRLGPRPRESRYRWEFVDARFDAAASPREALKFGWIVEVDPFAPNASGKKRTALGRFKHEGATPVVTRDGRVAVYMGDDEPFEYFYKFVTEGRFDPARPERNRDLLDEGTLYVARFDEDGTGEWLPLAWAPTGPLSPAAGFRSQADVVLRCREAADRVGATPLDRPEDVAVSPITGRVYVSCTQNLSRGAGRIEVGGRVVATAPHAACPRAPNEAGHILEIAEDGDGTARTFRWEVFVLAGAPREPGLLAALPLTAAPLEPDATYFGGYAQAARVSAFANPDNLGFDADGNLWIVTDGAQPGGANNGCFVCPTEGRERGRVRRFMSGPRDAEIAGCEIAPDGRTLFLSVQHPGDSGRAVAPGSRWPDGGDAAPRPSLIAIEPTDPRRRLGE